MCQHHYARRRARPPTPPHDARAEREQREAATSSRSVTAPMPAFGRDVLYAGQPVTLAAADWESQGWSRAQALDYVRLYPRHTRGQVIVISHDAAGPLIHYHYHSQELAWGYRGSGPADLARSILLHFHGVVPVRRRGVYPPRAEELPISYRQFEHDVVARLARDEPWTLTGAEIGVWVARHR